jgi:hypothetical protein
MKLMLYMILIMASAISIVAGEDYSHKYDTFEIGFSTPHQTAADVQWGTEKVGMKILVNLSTGERPFVFRHTLTTWDSKVPTNANLESYGPPMQIATDTIRQPFLSWIMAIFL